MTIAEDHAEIDIGGDKALLQDVVITLNGHPRQWTSEELFSALSGKECAANLILLICLVMCHLPLELSQ